MMSSILSQEERTCLRHQDATCTPRTRLQINFVDLTCAVSSHRTLQPHLTSVVRTKCLTQYLHLRDKHLEQKTMDSCPMLHQSRKKPTPMKHPTTSNRNREIRWKISSTTKTMTTTSFHQVRKRRTIALSLSRKRPPKRNTRSQTHYGSSTNVSSPSGHYSNGSIIPLRLSQTFRTVNSHLSCQMMPISDISHSKRQIYSESSVSR